MSQTYASANAEVENGQISDGGKHVLRRLSVAGFISFCINIGLVVFIVRYQTKHSNRQGGHTPSLLRNSAEIQRDSVCVECGVSGLSHDQGVTSRSVPLISVRGGDLCCIPDADGLWRLLNLFTVKAIMLKQKKKLEMLPPPSALLYLDTLEDNNYKWSDEYGFGAAHIVRPIKLKDGLLIIERSGLYNIYSFITLKRRTNARKTSTIHHSVRRITHQKTPHTDVVLERDVELPAKSETFNVSYLSGVIHLLSQDELYVDVSEIGAIYRFAPSNFFGVHFIQEV